MFCTIESQCSIFWRVFLSLAGVFRKRESKKIDVAKNSFLHVFEKIIDKPGVMRACVSGPPKFTPRAALTSHGRATQQQQLAGPVPAPLPGRAAARGEGRGAAMSIVVVQARGERVKACYAVREQVFIVEQQVPSQWAVKPFLYPCTCLFRLENHE
jgi:hypothetical protein